MEIGGTSAAAEHTETRERTQWPMNSIFLAPEHIRAGRESNFRPKLVSIGPYYHGRENLQRMEYLKLQCVPEIQGNEAAGLSGQEIQGNEAAGLSNYPIQDQNPSIYRVPFDTPMQRERDINDVPVQQFMDLEEEARAYYKHEVQEGMAFLDVNIKEVRSDLLLLENQIPLFFIRRVYETFFPSQSARNWPTLINVLTPFIRLDMPWIINDEGMSFQAIHLLHLYWRCSLSSQMYNLLSELEVSNPEGEQPTWAATDISCNEVIANATELQKTAGIEFEKFKVEGHLEVKFFKGRGPRGIMRMPHLKIDSRQTILLVNLIAFENCIIPSMRTFSCYMKLMDALIDSEEDVKLLQKCGVIYNTLSSHKMAATFFNEIGNACYIDYSTNQFSGLYKDVQKYYNSSWHRRWANLQQNYFSSPWAGISVAAGMILLILSALQTFYTIDGYYHPKK